MADLRPLFVDLIAVSDHQTRIDIITQVIVANLAGIDTPSGRIEARRVAIQLLLEIQQLFDLQRDPVEAGTP